MANSVLTLGHGKQTNEERRMSKTFIPLEMDAFDIAVRTTIVYGFCPMFVSEEGTYLIPMTEVFAMSKIAQKKIEKKIKSLRNNRPRARK
jgi:hypothetical protein